MARGCWLDQRRRNIIPELVERRASRGKTRRTRGGMPDRSFVELKTDVGRERTVESVATICQG